MCVSVVMNAFLFGREAGPFAWLYILTMVEIMNIFKGINFVILFQRFCILFFNYRAGDPLCFVDASGLTGKKKRKGEQAYSTYMKQVHPDTGVIYKAKSPLN